MFKIKEISVDLFYSYMYLRDIDFILLLLFRKIGERWRIWDTLKNNQDNLEIMSMQKVEENKTPKSSS